MFFAWIIPTVLCILMIIKFFQIAKEVRLIKRFATPSGDFTTLQKAVLGDKESIKKILLIDYHQTVGALMDKKSLNARNYQAHLNKFMNTAKELGVEFTEDEVARISDYLLFKKLYRYC